MEKKYCVYKHTNKINGKIYIGITGDVPENRWANGLRYQANAHFTNAINKYGWDGFEHDILYTDLSLQEASKIEVELIAKYQSSDREFGYNIALGGIGSASISDETRKKMSESHLGERNHNFGKPKSDEVKKKLSASNKKFRKEHPPQSGWHHSEESRLKMSQKLKGRKSPLEGKHHKPDTVNKIREANSRPVFCIETNEIYPNAREAADAKGTQYSSISQVCNGHRKLAGGYSWRFATAEDQIKNTPKVDNDPKNPSYFKAVQCVETGEVFSSLAEAARSINRGKSTVCAACKNSLKTAGGYHWQYMGENCNTTLMSTHTTITATPNPTNYKAVRCIETGAIYLSMAEAARWSNTSRQEIRRACLKKTKLAGGYHWEHI